MTALLALSLLAPLLLASLLLVPGPVRRTAVLLAPWSPAPALLLGLLAPAGLSLELPWLLLGSAFGVDQLGRVFLLLTAIVWLLAGVYAVGYISAGDRPRFFAFHLLSYAGNLGVVLAHDIASFYLAFVLMTLAAFGLIIFEGTRPARRAALVYLVLAMAGEGLMLYGLIVAARAVGNLELPAMQEVSIGRQASLLLVLAFGVKAGLPLLHVWLPLAHPEAPTPASAVLSGAMIKAGLLGWLRFLPLGIAALPLLGWALVAAGLFAAFYAALWGLFQKRPKALLAYSSVSQMGFMTMPLGAALILPSSWPLLAWAVSLFAFHHALTKGALFLGYGVAQHSRRGHPLLVTGLALAAATLVGLPFTGGALAKSGLKEALHPFADEFTWGAPAVNLLTVAAAGTALLMLRFIAMILTESNRSARLARPGLSGPWIVGVAALVAGAPLLAAWLGHPLYGYSGFDAAKLWDLLWPSLLATALYLLLLRGRLPSLPAGDVLIPVEQMLLALTPRIRRTTGRLSRWGQGSRSGGKRRTPRASEWHWLERLEGNLMRWDSAGALLMILGALIMVALWRSTSG